MNHYLYELETSSLPVPLWGVAIFWMLIFCLNHWLSHRTRAQTWAQAAVKQEGPVNVERSVTFKSVVLPLLMAAAVFTVSHAIGGPALPLLAGGWVLTMAASLAVSLASLLGTRAASRPGADTGTVTYTDALVLRQLASRCFGLAAFCLIAGLLVAHLAFFGGALFIGAAGVGQMHRAAAS